MARSDLNFSTTNFLVTNIYMITLMLHIYGSFVQGCEELWTNTNKIKSSFSYTKYLGSIEEKIEHYSFAQANDRKN